MTLDDWVDLIKSTVGSADLKEIGVEFLREHFLRAVRYTDGKGDGGTDAWVILQSEPPMQVAAQFHAGKSEAWDKKLASDLSAFCAYRDSLAPGDPRRQDFKRLYFVCTQSPDATLVETTTQGVLDERGVSVQVFDARAIASLALQNRGALWRLIARRVPGYEASSRPLAEARDEALVAFSFFHEKPAKYRWAVSKSAIATVLHRHGGVADHDVLVRESATLLRLSTPSKLIARTVRDLQSEGMIEVIGGAVHARDALTESTRSSLALSVNDQAALRAQCVKVLTPLVPKGRHHRDEVATRAVGAIFDDLGLFVRLPIAEQVQSALDPASQPRSRYERETFIRWKSAAMRIEQELGTDTPGPVALQAVVRVIAESPFAKSLAAAELFLRLTEHDAQEFAQALSVSSQRVLVDTSVALPMLCALFDEPVRSWKTSEAAHELHRSLSARGARCVIPSVYVEEIAVHLLNARDFAEVIESDAELERSRNYFVAHFCSLRAGARSGARTRREFVEFLADFGAPRGTERESRTDERRRAEQAVRRTLARYEVEVEVLDTLSEEIPLRGEPPRAPVLLRHDRSVVRALQRWAKVEPRWLVCTADSWLRALLNDLEIVALDSVGLGDLLELVKPTDAARALLAPLELAASIGEQEREFAASVWDEIVALEGPALRDRDLVRRAASFRNVWLARRRDDTSLSEAWVQYRDTGAFDER